MSGQGFEPRIFRVKPLMLPSELPQDERIELISPANHIDYSIWSDTSISLTKQMELQKMLNV